MINIRLKFVQLYNWTSYWNTPVGEEGFQPHQFGFSSDSNRNGYAIFGENSRGKSSFTDAIQWVLFGEAWTKPISQDGRQIKRTKRPLVGHPEDQVDPLLNTHAFLSGHYEFFVVITIEHNGVEYTITRSVGPRRKTVKSDSDMEVSLSIKNKDSGSTLEGAEAQDFIESEILPKNLSRFFFIDGESIAEYRALIASKDENLALRRNIEDILNFPILKRGIPDLDGIAGTYIDKLADLDKSKKRNRRLKEKIDDLSEKIKSKEKMIQR